MGRLVEARARGKILSQDNYNYLCRHRSLHGGLFRRKAQEIFRNQGQMEERIFRQINTETQAVIGGR